MPLPTALLVPTRGAALAPLRWRLAAIALSRGQLMLKGRAPGNALDTFDAGLAAVLASLAVHEADADAHKYAGILLAKSARDIRGKIENSFRIRDHAARAVALRPHDPLLHHVLGVWCYEVASLSMASRMLAATFFTAPPRATFDDALAHLRRAEDEAEAAAARVAQAGGAPPPGGGIAGPWMTNRLKLAQTAWALGRKAEAAEWLAKAATLPVTATEDETAEAQAAALAKSLRMPWPPQARGA